MKIIITMAGTGSRYKNEGIDKYKHQITYKGVSLFKNSISSLKDYFDREWIFIARGLNKSEIDEIRDECFSLQIYNINILNLDEKTDGQAETVLFAIDNYFIFDESILIYNIDTKILNLNYPKDLFDNFDGSILSFPALGDHWSFVNVSKNIVTNIEEKNRISELATAGLYFFKSAYEFRKYFLEFKDEILCKYGEIYIAPIYKKMIESGKLISNYTISRSNIIPMGKPEELDEIDKNYDWRKENNNTNI